MLTTLVRSTDLVPDTMAGLDAAVLADAAKKLHYQGASRALAAAKGRASGLNVLETAGVVPLRADRVRKYKAERYARPVLWSALLALAGMALLAGTAFSLSAGHPNWFLTVGGIVVGGIGGAGLMVIGFCRAINCADYDWQRIRLTDYHDPVPTFALNTALAIDAATPGDSSVTFYVEALKLRQHVDPDPFLVAVVDGQDFYVDVWDEPSFAARRRV
jgi:hypothetical protein